MTVLSFIYTISQSQISMIQYALMTNPNPLTFTYIKNIFITAVDQTGFIITTVFLILLVDEKIWEKPTASSP